MAGEDFVSEQLIPAPGCGDLAAMATGVPGAPTRFQWRGDDHVLTQICSSWKSTGKELGETYLRRHYFEIVTDTGWRMTIYCERQTKNRAKPKARWWVYKATKA